MCIWQRKYGKLQRNGEKLDQNQKRQNVYSKLYYSVLTKIKNFYWLQNKTVHPWNCLYLHCDPSTSVIIPMYELHIK